MKSKFLLFAFLGLSACGGANISAIDPTDKVEAALPDAGPQPGTEDAGSPSQDSGVRPDPTDGDSGTNPDTGTVSDPPDTGTVQPDASSSSGGSSSSGSSSGATGGSGSSSSSGGGSSSGSSSGGSSSGAGSSSSSGGMPSCDYFISPGGSGGEYCPAGMPEVQCPLSVSPAAGYQLLTSTSSEAWYCYPTPDAGSDAGSDAGREACVPQTAAEVCPNNGCGTASDGCGGMVGCTGCQSTEQACSTNEPRNTAAMGTCVDICPIVDVNSATDGVCSGNGKPVARSCTNSPFNGLLNAQAITYCIPSSFTDPSGNIVYCCAQ